MYNQTKFRTKVLLLVPVPPSPYPSPIIYIHLFENLFESNQNMEITALQKNLSEQENGS